MRAETPMTAVERLPLLTLFLVNPLLLFPFVTDQALLRWLLVALSLAVAFAASARLTSRVWAYRLEVWPLAALCLLVVARIWLGAPVAEGIRWCVVIVLGSVTYLYCRVLDSGDRRGSIGLLVMAGGAIGVYAMFQALGLDVVPYAAESWMYRVATTFGHRNFTAAFLVVVFLCGLWLLRDSSASPGRWYGVSMGLVYCGLLATGSRFPILAGTVALAVFFGAGRRWRWIACGGLVVFAAWALVIVGRGEMSTVLTRTETFALRADLYRSALGLTAVQPVVGLGPGGFARAIPAAVAPDLPADVPGLVFLHAHFLPAELLIDFGLLGLSLSLVFVIPVWAGAFRRKPALWGGLVWAHVCWLVINAYDVSFFDYAGWVTFWPLLAMIRSENDAGRCAGAGHEAGWFPRTLMVLLMSMAVLVLAPMLRSSHHSFRGAATLAADNAAVAVVEFEHAQAIWPLPIGERYQCAVAVLKSGQTARAVESLLEIETQAPGFSAVRYNLAMAHARLGQSQEAARWVRLHLDFYPMDTAALESAERLEREGVPGDGPDAAEVDEGRERAHIHESNSQNKSPYIP